MKREPVEVAAAEPARIKMKKPEIGRSFRDPSDELIIEVVGQFLGNRIVFDQYGVQTGLNPAMKARLQNDSIQLSARTGRS